MTPRKVGIKNNPPPLTVGMVWELRDTVRLAFPCKEYFYDKVGKQIRSYIVETNGYGYYWGYFWVVGKHVNPVQTQSRWIGGQKLSTPNTSDYSRQSVLFPGKVHYAPNTSVIDFSRLHEVL